MVLKTISPGCGVWATLMLFLSGFFFEEVRRGTAVYEVSYFHNLKLFQTSMCNGLMYKWFKLIFGNVS